MAQTIQRRREWDQQRRATAPHKGLGRTSIEWERGFRDGYEGLRPTHGTARYLAGWRDGRESDAMRRALYGRDPTRLEVQP